MKKILFLVLLFPVFSHAQVPPEFEEYEAGVAAGAARAKHCRVELNLHGEFLDRCDRYAEFMDGFKSMHEDYLIKSKHDEFIKLLNENVSDARWNQHKRNIESLEKDFRFFNQMLK